MSPLLISTRKGMFLSQAGQAPEPLAFIGDPVSLAYGNANSPWFAALNLGHFGTKMHRSDDQGKTWKEIACPAFAEQSDDDAPTVEMIWALERDRSNRMWAGTIPGALFYSDDEGESWHLVASLWNVPERGEWFGGGADKPGIHSICIHPDNENRITIGISCGGVWHSEDRGESWHLACEGMEAEYMPPEQANAQNIQDPHCIVQCRSNPDVLWCQHHNGIFKSNNRGHNWTRIYPEGPSDFGFPVAVHPKDANTAWFIPAKKDEHRYPVDGKVVVNKTQDGGDTFHTINEGLPDPAWDLVYRHALTIDDQGDHLAFGSTTGSCCLSQDGGESWQTLSANLPPIYGMRFVQP